MITSRLQIFAVTAVIVFLAGMILLLKQKKLELKYSLLWLLGGLIMLILALFPQLLDSFSALVGVYSPVNALLAVMIGFGLMLMISFTAIVSHEKKEIVRLVQEVSLLEKRIRELEKAGEETEK